MRRWIAMAGALLIFSFLPSPGTELGELSPAALLFVYREGEEIIIETDTACVGRGSTIRNALDDMNQTSSGRILLDTVENLVVSSEAKQTIPQLQELLRPGVLVCKSEKIDAEKAWRYLRIHKPSQRLKDVSEDTKLEQLVLEEERMWLLNE